MARGLSSSINTYLAGLSLVRVALIEIETTGASVYYTDNTFDITHGGNTYEAQGNFLGVGETEENAELIITTVTLVISALLTSNVTTFAQSGMVNKKVTISYAYLDPTDNSIIDTPIIMFQGKVNGYQINDNGATATIALEVASIFSNFEKTAGRRTNEANFRQEHPNDRSMEFAHVVTKDITWGRL